MVRQLIAKMFLPNLEKDLSRTVGREVAKMECTSNFAPSVYGFRPKTGSVGGGAFGSTSSPMQQHLTRVDIAFTPNKGLF